MTHFIHPDFPTTHRGVERLQAAAGNLQQLARRVRSADGLVALVLAGAFSALVVAADQLVSTWADGEVVLAWATLWLMMFVGVLLFSQAARGWSRRLVALLEAWSSATAQRAEDERTWRAALADPRFMSELQVARWRAEAAALESGEAPPAWPFHTMTSARPERGFMG